ncbi:integral membrane-like protein [Sphingobium sp. AN558]|uniref:integral membrane-like protein n=1 Tax=Sphingobium sp. AN558 TaxID=3133442 RepID=UPI0030BD81E8
MISLLNRRALTLLALGALLMLPTFLFGPGASHSHLYNYIWTGHFGEQLAAGHLYERWLPRSFEGLGSPTFYFYPPLAYWISGGFNAAGFSIFQAINLAGLILLVASGLAMHAFLANRVARPLLGAALYMAAPYHLYDFYVRGALAEFAAFLWLPLIALAIDRLPARRGVALLAVAYAGLILTHLPVAMLTGVFLIAPLMARRIWQDRAALPAGLLAGLMAIGLAAFYLLPAITLQGHVSTELLWNERYRATSWSIWQDGAEIYIAMAAGAILLAWPARSIWSAITVVTALASIRLIPFIWDIDLLNKAQFPWRALCIVEFTAVTALMHYRPRAVLLTAALLSLTLSYAILIGISAKNLRTAVDYPRIALNQPDAPEYLPLGFDASRVDPYDRSTDLSAVRSLPRGDSLLVQRPMTVRLGHAAFPIWRVTRDDRTVASTGPLIQFQAMPGRYLVERVRLWQESAGAVLSVLGLLLLALLLMPRRINARLISHLSKFPSYSPCLAIFDRTVFGWLGRSRHSGGDT